MYKGEVKWGVGWKVIRGGRQEEVVVERNFEG